MAEALAVFKALEWAKSKGWRHVEVLTDLRNHESSSVLVRPILVDIVCISSWWN